MNGDSLTAMKPIVITRPAHQAQPLLDRISELGNSVHHLPLLQLVALKPTELNPTEPPSNQYWIFISPNAVNYAKKNLSHKAWQRLGQQPVFAIGQATKSTLHQQGIHQVTIPKLASSESLLELAALQQPLNKRIIIACGKGGRRLLEQQLKQRGATITRYECYQRNAVDQDSFITAQLAVPNNALWVVTSAEAMQVLEQFTQRQVDCMVSSDRLAEIANAMEAIKSVTLCKSAQTEDIIDGIKQLNQP